MNVCNTGTAASLFHNIKQLSNNTYNRPIIIIGHALRNSHAWRSKKSVGQSVSGVYTDTRLQLAATDTASIVFVASHWYPINCSW